MRFLLSRKNDSVIFSTLHDSLSCLHRPALRLAGAGVRPVNRVRNVCFANAPIRKLNRRAAALPLASLVSLDSFTSLHPPLAALSSVTSRQSRLRRFQTRGLRLPTGSIVALLRYRLHCSFRQPPSPRFNRHRRRFGYGALVAPPELAKLVYPLYNSVEGEKYGFFPPHA